MKPLSAAWLLGIAFSASAADAPIRVRTSVELFKGSGAWRQVELDYPLPAARTAIIVCDMWDRHWCRGANERVAPLVERAEPVLRKLRASGMLIIHAPSETMEFYKQTPQRKAIAGRTPAALPTPLPLTDPPLPVDSADGGCDTPDQFFKAWSRQHPGLTIGPDDLISDNGAEVYAALQARGITHLLVMGVHTNMCILNRTFAIRQMTKWGIQCILLRDLTDSMYDPKDKPYVSHDAGTELVVGHIEKYWAPSARSSDVLRGLGLQ